MRAYTIVCLCLLSVSQCSELLSNTTSNSGQYSCNISPYSPSLRNAFYLQGADKIIIQVISPFSLISSMLVILFYIKFPGTREQPGDIILAIAVSQLFLIIGYLCTSIYNTYIPIDLNQIGPEVPMPPSFSTFCTITGYMIVLSFCAEFLYNICFCVFFIVIIKNVLKSWHKEKWVVHVICLLATAAAGLVFYFFDQIGVSLFGVCGLKVSTFSPFFRSILVLVYFLVLIISTVYFRRHIPAFENNSEKRKMFLRYYYRYIISVSINLTLQTTCDMVAAVNCQKDSPNDYIEYFITLSNTFSMLTPVIICPVMFTHPDVKNGVHQLFLNWLGQNKNKNQKEMRVENNSLELQPRGGLLENILEMSKTRLIYSILCALVIEDHQITGLPSLRMINEWNYSDRMQIKMNEEILKEFEGMAVKSMRLLDVDIISHSPRVFKTLMISDGFNNLAGSLNPKLNEESIKKSSHGDGGRSGQFFFFSFDNQIIIKTLSKKQLDVLMSRLQPLTKHFEEHPNSLITKIYGVYTLSSKETGEEYHLFVMRNLSGCDRRFITRIYDLKGSRLDRQVIKEYSGVGENISKTMKDIDFQNIEGRLFIPSEQIESLKEILIDDSQFLKVNLLIDYSLIVMKMNLSGYLNEKQMLLDQFRSKQTNPYSIIPSTKETGVAYVIGVIDFLQTWTTKKKSQKFTKVFLFFKFKTSNEVSAQAPELYSHRFITQVVNMIV